MAMGNEDPPENGSVDDSTKQKDIRQPDESQTLMKTSSTLFEPSERSISTTTIREGVLSESLGSSPVFKNGHGVCCDPDLIKRCLDHDSDEDVVPTRQQLPSSYPMAHVHVAVDPSKYPYSYHGWVTTLSRKRRKRMAAKARAALKK